MVHGNSLGMPHFDAPVATKSCGTFFWFRYFCTTVLVGVPSSWKIAKTWSSSTSLRTISTVLGGWKPSS